ncbi:site-specific tyrosine recombinase XerD [Symmachiella dynata]|uniref:tyrosine-type recombinase/integrase n=1 Tax=Symmachiella dynata TaxID=2527995 RepID=UPI00118B98BD|nr:site-specific integrase [Symmachiella dynata]QDT49480.1 site-specific tyrosine recombinase XerD [Symmachiella dynata]
MSAWVKQIASQVKKHGEEKASWYCFWTEPDGTRRKKSCGAGAKGQRLADRMAEKRKAELLLGSYKREERKTWKDFRVEYERRVLPEMKPNSAAQIRYTLDRFEELAKPKRIGDVNKRTVDTFIEKRREQRGRKPNSKVTPSTVNRDLTNIRAALNVAAEWGYIAAVPKIRLLKVPQRLPNFVTPEHFADIFNNCDAATAPKELPFPQANWWRALLTMAQMTGWRIGELLSLKWTDVDLEAGTAVTRYADNKGGRSERIALHPVVVDQLRGIRSFDDRVFPWDKDRRSLYNEFARIQDAAGIKIPCPDAGNPNHGECTDACNRYGFHDERRAFATLNAEHMTREALQALMRHMDSATTDRYINYARQVNPAVANLHVPDVLKASGTA